MKTRHPFARWAILLLPLFAACQTNAPKAELSRESVQQRIDDGRELWEKKCRTVAGEKIYRKVENVEGVLLMKVRPQRGDRELSDRNWPGAAFARESRADEHIKTFLGYEYGSETLHGQPTPITPQYRGYISPDRRPGGLPGYRWVEVIDDKDGQRYRYTGRYDEPWKTDPSYSKSYVRFNLDKTPATTPPPRYGVTYEDHVIPEERELGIASSTIKVIDLKTNEVLGEMTRYAWSPGAPSRVNPVPWLTAYRCPEHPRGAGEATRLFVDQVLSPAKEK